MAVRNITEESFTSRGADHDGFDGFIVHKIGIRDAISEMNRLHLESDIPPTMTLPEYRISRPHQEKKYLGSTVLARTVSHILGR
jgi:hypothetical protein